MGVCSQTLKQQQKKFAGTFDKFEKETSSSFRELLAVRSKHC